MSEPKKETVRIVLPPRREGQPLSSTPRETAMINLPPKPVPASADAPPAPPAPPSAPPAMPAPPAGLQPPSAPGVPKPPGMPGVPKPPAPPSAPGVPKPLSAPPSVVKAPSSPTVMLKVPPSVGPAPAAVTPAAKKETAKINPASGIAVKPQATVKLQPRPPQPSQTTSATFKVKSSEIIPAPETVEEEEIPMNLSIITLVAAVVALALQIWIMTS
ncbi:MAG: hypothetical protein ACREKL_15795 [Chthoniobacterales bacterium]